jgi:hypothetical protein
MSLERCLSRVERAVPADRLITVAVRDLLRRLTDDELTVMEHVRAVWAESRAASAERERAAQAAWERVCRS